MSTALRICTLFLALWALTAAPARADEPIVLLEDHRELYVAGDQLFPAGPILPFDVTHTREGFMGELTSSFQGADFEGEGSGSGGPVEPAADPEVFSILSFRFRVDSPAAYKLEGSLYSSAVPSSAQVRVIRQEPDLSVVYDRGVSIGSRDFESTVALTPGTYDIFVSAYVGNVNQQASFSITGKVRPIPTQLPVGAPVGVGLVATFLASGASLLPGRRARTGLVCPVL